jgi:hypothetical protein
MNQYYAELCESDFKTLSTLKQLIESHDQYSIAYQEALSEYKDFLVETINDLSDPLPPEIEIDKELLPQEYIDFKVDYSIHGPYTIDRRFRDREAVYLIEVTSVSSKDYGSKIFAKILKSYKKNTCGLYFSFSSSATWGPRFKEFEIAIVFLLKTATNNKGDYPDYGSHNFEDKIEIIQRGNSRIAISPIMDTSYWNGLDFVKREQHVEIDFSALNSCLEDIAERF